MGEMRCRERLGEGRRMSAPLHHDRTAPEGVPQGVYCPAASSESRRRHLDRQSKPDRGGAVSEPVRRTVMAMPDKITHSCEIRFGKGGSRFLASTGSAPM
jgi:hypothetical protein